MDAHVIINCTNIAVCSMCTITFLRFSKIALTSNTFIVSSAYSSSCAPLCARCHADKIHQQNVISRSKVPVLSGQMLIHTHLALWWETNCTFPDFRTFKKKKYPQNFLFWACYGCKKMQSPPLFFFSKFPALFCRWHHLFYFINSILFR